ncbi:prenyltransferase [Stigmatella sp. ncwal1]|uniref:Prenyltransferase n=1 Tax=Stigmatella ashevillensis TaxID=2995309 RepID=A0ABT5D1F3_9BACT|nr:prenyltransferase [Stigmatella ashevillena]MDC0707490.1 prenyltransferase [Stigmatella ashevillena]
MTVNVLTQRLLELGRVKFLLYSPILYTVGAIIPTLGGGSIDALRFIHGVAFTWITHLMTHYCNEYYDLEPDRANKAPSPWTGGSRVLVKGLLEPKLSLHIAYALAGVSLVLALLMPTLSARVLCLLAIFFSWEYSAPPFKLEALGLGEFTVTLVLNTLVPLLGYCLQSGGLQPHPLLLVLIPLGIIEYIRMMVMNMADWESDAKTWKKTLVVRIGIENAVKVHGVGMVLAYLSLIPLYRVGVPLIVILALASTAYMGLRYAYRLQKGAWRKKATMWIIPYVASTHNGLGGSAALIGMILLKPGFSPSALEFFPLYLYLGGFFLLKFMARLKQQQTVAA